MLIGNNKLTLNQATMVAAVQHYFDTVVFAEGKSPKVTQVEKDSKSYADEFAVSVEEKERAAAGEAQG